MIDLYTAGTMNGRRAAIALAECGLAHRVHKLDLAKGEQRRPEFLKLNPNGAIPVIVDPDGPANGRAVVAQSGAIVLYCAEKSGKLIPADAQSKLAAFTWFMQALTDVGTASSMLFQLSLAPERSPALDSRFLERFLKQCRNVDQRLAGREYLAEEVSIADVALYPIVALRSGLIQAADGLDDLKAWEKRMAARPSVASALAANG
jgi:GST-like protein